MSDTTIRIDEQSRDRLASIAAARGMTIGGLVEDWATRELTPQERLDASQASIAYLREHVAPNLTDDAILEAQHLRARIGRGELTA